MEARSTATHRRTGQAGQPGPRWPGAEGAAILPVRSSLPRAGTARLPADPSADAAHAPCRNCGTVLQGPYCHVCGQHGHDPLRSVAHAVEDVFESFWHLDGRVFRTLRDLLVPGRLAAAYLDGRRARYLPPLRLFVILTVLTFFVGKLTLHVDPGTSDHGIAVGAGTIEAGTVEAGTVGAGTAEAGAAGPQSDFVEISAAASPADLLQRRSDALREMRAARETDAGAWFAPALEEFARPRIDAATLARMRALAAAGQASDADLAQLEAQIRAEAAGGGDDALAGAKAGAAQAGAEAGPIRRWLARRGLRLRENAALIQREPDTFVRLFLGAVPGALFLLVPLFALCLKLLYVRSGRGYLQHLAVALYSHCLMLLALLVVFAVTGLQGLLGWMGGMAEVFAMVALGLGVPIYLLLMQKRVYGQGWGRTLVKYALLGATYTVLLGMAGMYAVIAGLST